MEETKESKANKKKTSKIAIFIPILILLILIAGGIGGYFVCQNIESNQTLGSEWGDKYYLYLKEAKNADEEQRKNDYGILAEKSSLQFCQTRENKEPEMIMNYTKDDKEYTNIYFIDNDKVNYIEYDKPSNVELLYNIEEKNYIWYVHTKEETKDSYKSISSIIEETKSSSEEVMESKSEYTFTQGEMESKLDVAEGEIPSISKYDQTFIKPEVQENKKIIFDINADEKELKESIQEVIKNYKDKEEIITEKIKNAIQNKITELEGIKEEIQDKIKNLDNIYFEVLDGKKSYIDSKNKQMYVSDFLNQSFIDGTTKIEYTLLDMDGDGSNEMVVFFNYNSDGMYLILNNENGTVYGFEEVYRGMLRLKTDGTYLASGGAATNVIIKSTFNKNVKNDELLAESDWGWYKVAGKYVTESEYQKCMNEFLAKPDAKFTFYKEIDKEKNQEEENVVNTTNTTSQETKEQEQTAFTEGTYIVKYNDAELEQLYGRAEKIELKNGIAKYENNYLGGGFTGTYTVSGNIITVKFTKETGIYSDTGEKYEQSINETRKYIIESSTIVVDQSTGYKYYSN